jgi:hypothetical protein
MFNGSYISFPGAQPEYANQRTMVPFRAFIEAHEDKWILPDPTSGRFD